MRRRNSPDNSTIEWQSIQNDGKLDSFAEFNQLNTEALRLTEPGVIVLPSNSMLLDMSKENNLFPRASKDVLKLLRGSGLAAHLYDDGKDKREIICDSADVILPTLLFLGDKAIAVALSVLAGWIYDRWVRRRLQQQPSLRVEYAEVASNDTIVRWRRVEGPASEVQRLLSEEAQLHEESDPLSETKTSGPESADECGDPEEWWENHCRNLANAALKTACDLIRKADESIAEKKMDTAESLYRESLVKIREATLLEPENEAHRLYLHDVGRHIHDTFKCTLEFRDGSYYVTCPVMLSHTKGGFSIGGSGISICTICGKNSLDCSHTMGEIYNGVSAKRYHNICNICGQSECEHEEGKVYDGARAFGLVAEMNLDHIAFVQNPANPLCAISSYSLSKSDVLEMLSWERDKEFVYGETPLFCQHCLVCTGA